MGNPYVIGDFPAIQNYVCAFSNATVSETAAVKAVFGEIPIGGHLPVTIPGIANRGEGLERPARAASGGSAMFTNSRRSKIKRSRDSKWSIVTATRSRRRAIDGHWTGVGALFAALCVLPACSINVDKNGEKDGSKRVDIQSPVGDLHVSEKADIHDAGLSVYPGAKPAPKDSGDDEKSANVNLIAARISVEGGGGGVPVRRCARQDHAYYDKELQKFGKPIQCQGNTALAGASMA